VAAWEYNEKGEEEMHKEKLHFDVVKQTQRSYK
jgi:hypothetical protein